MFSLEESAKSFATGAHGAINQRRKFTNEPYIVHPGFVAAIVKSVAPHDPAMIAAAWLHDVVEDTGVSIDQIRGSFGTDVADLVGWLTNVAKPEDGNRAARKAINRAHSAAAPARAQTIKMADVIDNCRNVADLDPDFAAIYLPEKATLIDALVLADPALIAQAKAFVEVAVV